MSDVAMMKDTDVAPAAERARAILGELDRQLLGRPELHRLLLVGILSRGHVLLEGLPGLGKTALVKALSEIMRLEFKRIQFTPDLMPSDILGSHILQPAEDGSREMEFRPGPVFCNILLADEINRASPKTQSAMLETMQEHSVTLLGQTRKLPEPFFVLASQNPIELEGTYPLPEAQLDRFLFRLEVPAASAEVMHQIITSRRRGTPPEPEHTVGAEELADLFEVMDRIFLPKPVARYISRLVAATHPDNAEASEQVAAYVRYGASPRAAIAIAESARASALLDGRATVGFEDVKTVALAVLNHRVILNYKAKFDTVTATGVVRSLIDTLDPVGLNLPEAIELEEGGCA